MGREMPTVLALVIAAAMTLGEASAACRLESGPRHVVTKVIDGETLVLDDGSEVRMIGALAPREADAAAADGTWVAGNAAASALEVLAAGKAVHLKFGGERKDRYGRWLAHVFVIGGDGGETWLQAAMLRAGHARGYALQGNRACLGELLEAESEARAVGLGLWSVPTYRVRDASRPRDLAFAYGSFRVIAGTVRNVTGRRETIKLWLEAPSRRDDVSVSIKAADRELIGSFGGDAKALVGRRIEVRGWLDQRRAANAGPEIDVSTAGLLVIDPP